MAANALTPNGFHPSRQISGGAPNYQLREMRVAYNYASKIAFGDPVFLGTDGNMQLYVKGGVSIFGSFRGCRFLDPTAGRTVFSPAWNAPAGLASTTIVWADVMADPLVALVGQARGTAFTQANIGQNIDIFTGTSGTPTLAGMSVCAFDGTAAATATLPFRLVRIIPAPAFSAQYSEINDNQYVEVMMNTPQVAGGGAALGHA